MDLERIIQGCKDNESKAQRRLYELSGGKMYAVVRRYVVDEDQAKDVLQDAFVKVFSNISSFKSEGSFEGWMRRIVVNTALTALSKQRDFEDTEDVVLPSITSDNLEVTDLLSLLNLLPYKKRVVFNLYEIEGYSHKEIADMLDTTESASRAELSKAKVKLQELHKKINREFDQTS